MDLITIQKDYVISKYGPMDPPPRARFGPETNYGSMSDPLRPGLQAENTRVKTARMAHMHDKFANEAAAAITRRNAARGAAALGGAAVLGTGAVVGGRRLVQRRASQRAAVAQAAKRSRNLKIAGIGGAGLLAAGAIGGSRS